jgi:hypothetical protein
MNELMGRRRVLQGAGVAAGGAIGVSLGLSSPALADNDNGDGDGEDFLGSWMVIRQDDGDPAETTLVFSFAAGNVVLAHDIDPAGPPFTGTWTASGARRFRATFWAGFPGDQGPGSPGTTVRVQATGRLQRGLLSGTYTATAFAAGQEVERVTGVFSGSRIDA